MIKSNKRWLLTASPWMKHSLRLSSLAIGGLFFTALLVFTFGTSKAQTGGVKTVKGGSVRTGDLTVGTPAGGAPSMPVITGATTTTCVGTDITLYNTLSGGTWSASNGNVTLTPSDAIVTVHGNTPGYTVVTYTVGPNSIATNVTIMAPISGPAAVCIGNFINLTDATPTGIWTTSNPAVAIVNVTGTVTGIGNGTATISYQRISDHATCAVSTNVTVSNNALVITPAVPAVCVGSSVTLTGTPTGGSWASNTTTLATIGSATGIANGLAVGNPTITYTQGTCYATKTLIVSNTLPAGISGATTVCLGNTTTLFDATLGGTWTTNDPTIANVNSVGIVTGVAAGTTTITYSKLGCYRTQSMTVGANTTAAITGNTNICVSGSTTLSDTTTGGTWTTTSALVTLTGTATTTVTVTAGVSTGSAAITYNAPGGGCYQVMVVNINPTSVVGPIVGPGTVCKGSIINLTDPSNPGGTWSTADTNIAKVDAYGHVTGMAVAGGTVNIIYTRLGCSIPTIITVNPLPTLTGSASVCYRGTTTLTPAPTGGSWATSDTTIASVAAGVVTGVAMTGAFNITYTSPVGCNAIKAMTVNGPSAIILPGGSNTACLPLVTGGVGTYLYLSDTVSGGAWSSSATTVATVGASSGVVAPVATGTVTITYTKSGCSVTQMVSVNPLPKMILGSASACQGSTLTLSDSTSGGTWASSNTAIGTISSAGGVFGGVTPGSATVSYTVNGCAQTKNMTVGASLPAIKSASIYGFTVCSKEAYILITDSARGGMWSASGSTVSLAGASTSGFDTVKVTGISNSTVTITYTNGGCYVTKAVTVAGTSAAAITPVNGLNYGCTGIPANLKSGGSGPVPTVGTWTSRYGKVSFAYVNDTTTAVTGTSTGIDIVTFTRNDNGCLAYYTYAIYKQPSAIITPSVSVCNGTNITIKDTTRATGSAWSTSSSSTATATVATDSTATFKGITAGLVTVTYTTPGGCAVYQPILVKETPAAIGSMRSHTAALCTSGFGTTEVLYDSSYNGAWTTSGLGRITISGMGALNDSATITYVGTGAGTENVTYTINGCYVTKTITVSATHATFTPSTDLSVCLGGTLDTAWVPSVAGGTWSVFNQGSYAIASTIATVSTVSANGAAVIAGIGAGIATLTYNLFGCRDSVHVTVNPNTGGGISGTGSICNTGLGQKTTLTDATSGGVWSTSSKTIVNLGSTGTGSTAVDTGLTVGSAVIYYSIPKGGCIDAWSVNVYSVVPTAITGIDSVCLGSNVTLANATTGGTWISGTPAVASVSLGGNVLGLSAGITNITYSLNGCFPAPAAFTVNPVPAAITGTLTVCAGSVTALADATTGGAWTSSAPTKGSVDGSGNVTGVAAGSATISYTLYVGGCRATASVAIGDTGNIVLGGPTHQCGGTTITMTATRGTAVTGTWSSYNTGIATNAGAVFSGVGSGIDTVYFSTAGCPTVYKKLDTVNFVGPITSSSFVVCSTGVAAVTNLADVTGGGVWSISNTNAGITTGGVVTGSVPGYDTVTYKVHFIEPGADSFCSVTQIITIMPCGPKESNNPGSNGSVDQKFTVFPNPSNGVINFTQSEPSDGAMSVNVINYVGASVLNGNIDFAGGKGQLNLSHVVPGMYLVMLKDNKGAVQTFKVLIEK